MSKPKTERKLYDNQAYAKSNLIRSSRRKLDLVAALIRNLPVEEALVQLTFSKRRVAKEVKKCLESAIANAENNHQLDVDSLVVTEAVVGKAILMKRMRARARGRSAGIQKFFSNLSITVTAL